jgi:hypothetical protein
MGRKGARSKGILTWKRNTEFPIRSEMTGGEKPFDRLRASGQNHSLKVKSEGDKLFHYYYEITTKAFNPSFLLKK